MTISRIDRLRWKEWRNSLGTLNCSERDVGGGAEENRCFDRTAAGLYAQKSVQTVVSLKGTVQV